MTSNYGKPPGEKGLSIFVFCLFHILINLCIFVLHLTLRDLPFSIWHFQRKVTAITGRIQILTSDMVMMSHFVISFAKRPTALCTFCRVLVVSLLTCCQRCHVPVVSEYTRNYLTFAHDMVIKFIHNVRSAVHEGFALIFRVLAISVTRKTAHVVFINDIGCFYRKDSKSQTK